MIGLVFIAAARLVLQSHTQAWILFGSEVDAVHHPILQPTSTFLI